MTQKETTFTGPEPVAPHIAKFVEDEGFYVLREKRTNKALNVSYNPEGLV